MWNSKNQNFVLSAETEEQPAHAIYTSSSSSSTINVSSSSHSRIFTTSAVDNAMISTPYHPTLSSSDTNSNNYPYNPHNLLKNNEDTHKRTRNRRSVSYNPSLGTSEWANVSHSVETIVVVDSAMIRNHGEQNVTVYALTLLNMVNIKCI